MAPRYELDHVLVCTQVGAPEAEALVDFGLSEGSANRHPGQGTANRRFFFRNAMIELAFVVDSELVNESPVEGRLGCQAASGSFRIEDPAVRGQIGVAAGWTARETKGEPTEGSSRGCRPALWAVFRPEPVSASRRASGSSSCCGRWRTTGPRHGPSGCPARGSAGIPGCERSR